MNFNIETGLPSLTVFLQGLLSFFSPCVLPLLPIYISYLSGGTRRVDPQGMIHYPRKKVLLNTVFFTLGISFSFFVLGLGFQAAGLFLGENKMLFSRIGGIIVLLFGLYQLGVLGTSATLSKERRLPFHMEKLAMNPGTALVLGFLFSFAWTPCVGPTLASVLLMAASSQPTQGFFLIGLYTLGFVLPFLAVGFFTGTLLELFKKHQKVVNYTVKIGGALMVLIGIMMITGWMNSFTSYLSQFGGAQGQEASAPTSSQFSSQEAAIPSPAPSPATSGAASAQTIPAPDFTMTDQNGEEFSLSDFKGKTVFLNVWGTWCPPCRAEMPDVQKLYETYGKNEEEVLVIGVALPNQSGEGDVASIAAFMEENGYTYPCLMDETGEFAMNYTIGSFPTTFMIDKDSNIFGYVRGQITYDMMESIVEQTRNGERA